jgi:hypothetical protein
MTEREKAMARMQELAAGERCLAKPEDLLYACLTPTANYQDFSRSDREPAILSAELQEDVKILYQAVAAAPELSGFAKKRICYEACEKFFATVMSAEDLKAFKKANPLRDNYDPSFLDLTEVLVRVEKSGLLDAKWSLETATRVVQTALGDHEISEYSCGQLWKRLARYFKDECHGSFEDGHHANVVMSPAANRIQACLCKVVNTRRFQVMEPSDFTDFEMIAFRD